MAHSTTRARFAPSPASALHVGGARTAIFNQLFARNTGGAFLLRLEDTDLERSNGDSEAGPPGDLGWLGLDWDQGPEIGSPYSPYRQSECLDTYRYVAARLESDGKAYKCYCTDGEVRRRREKAIEEGGPAIYDGRCKVLSRDEHRKFENQGRKHSLRFRVDYKEVVHKDIIRGHVHFKTGMVGDFVLIRSDGMPTYNSACVVDDSAMAITLVIRGEENLPNKLRQLLLYRGLGIRPLRFAHPPLVLGPDRTMLSKRRGATSVGGMRRIGYPAAALVNYLALLGWSPGDDTEVMGREGLMRKFSMERVSSSPSIFDANKLQWVSSQYMKILSAEELVEGVAPFLQETGVEAGDGDSMLNTVLSLREAAKKYSAMAWKMAAFLEEPAPPDGELVEKMRSDSGRRAIDRFSKAVSRMDRADKEGAGKALARVLETTGLKKGEAFVAMRAALIRRRNGPEIPIIIEVLGKRRTLELLRAASESEAKS